MRFRSLLLLSALLATPSLAQRREPTPEQRIERLERQSRQLQRQVFPKGQPADTAGFSDAPAATKDVVDTLTSRLDAVERQMSELVRTSEESTHRLSTLEADLARLRAELDSRLKAAAETGTPGTAPVPGEPPVPGAAPAAPEPAAPAPAASAPPPRPEPVTPRPSRPVAAAPGTAGFEAGGEAAYDEGFQLWNAKQYDQAIAKLREMAAGFPGHRRVSWANNLIGRSLLDKGQYRAAAEALLANYRGNPKGERAPDSLFYLGQSLVKLGQPSQACKAYGELADVYGTTMRAELKKMLPAARTQAKCA